MSNHYRVRIDEINGLNTDDLIQLCDSVQHVLVRHELPTGNPHYHMYLVTNVKDAALRKRIKSYFPEITKTDYSIKNCDTTRINEYVQYLFNTKHGNKWELIDTLDFDDKLLHDLMEAAKEISDAYRETVKNTKKNTGPTIWELAEEVRIKFDEFNSQHGNIYRHTGSGRAEDFPEDARNEKIMIDVYTDETIQILRKHKKPYDEFLLLKIITTAMTVHDTGKNIMRKKMYKIFCNLY